jgi:hypothetical protein
VRLTIGVVVKEDKNGQVLYCQRKFRWELVDLEDRKDQVLEEGVRLILGEGTVAKVFPTLATWIVVRSGGK